MSLTRLWDRFFRTSKQRPDIIHRGGKRRTRALLCEPLEDRRMLTIVWANETAANAPTGSFTLTYGTSYAPAARTIVNHAIADWNRLVSTPQNISLTINATVFADPSLRGSTLITSIEPGGAKRPLAATIQLDDNGAGENWYFDPTPASDLEFSNMLTIYAAWSGSVGVQDFASTIVHEIGHAVGIASSTGLGMNSHLSSSPRGANYRTFTGNGYTAEMTTVGGLHVSEFQDSNDLMARGFTRPVGHRRLISQLDAFILRDAYGYSVLDPAQVDTMYVNQEPDGHIYVKGFAGLFADNITVYGVTNPPASAYSFSVNGTAEVAPTGPITIQTDDGNDTVTMDATSGYLWQQMSIFGGAGTDTLIYKGGVTGATYRYHFTDNFIGRTDKNSPNTPYAVSSYSGFDKVRLLADATDDVVEVSGTSGASAMELYLGNGANYLNGGGATIPLRAFGGTGDDVFIGGSGADILSTLGGDDTIAANGGRDLVFLGSGSDQIGVNVDNAEDLIVLGSTNWDANLAALSAILEEWTSGNSASVRKSHIQGTLGGGANGSYTLVLGQTMFADGQADVVHIDNQNLDWVLANNGLDTIFFDS